MLYDLGGKMKRVIFLLSLSKRREAALEIQKILTEYGCIIKTRLGVHDVNNNCCEEGGLIILEIFGEKKLHNELEKKLKIVKGIKIKIIKI